MKMVLEYVECIELPRLSWRRWNDVRAKVVDEIAYCVSFGNSLRKCSTEIARKYRVSYRRAEEAAKVSTIKRAGKKWIAYGKLVEVTLYVSYTCGPPSRHRHLEIRIILAVPLSKSCSGLLNIFDYIFTSALEKLDDSTAFYVEAVYNQARSGCGEWKIGCRELKEGLAKCDCETWCNSVYKCSYKDGMTLRQVIVYDYRGYVWTGGENICRV